jgi:hypothetical protein
VRRRRDVVQDDVRRVREQLVDGVLVGRVGVGREVRAQRIA